MEYSDSTPSEVGLQSAQLVAGQRADSPSLLDLDARLLAVLVATLAPLSKAQSALRPLLGDTLRSR